VAKKSGWAMIDILAVVGCILMLVQVILLAIQAQREIARKETCKNNLRKIGVACGIHLESTNRFPTGGWGFLWAGDPDRGNDKEQPGGWIFNLLPFLAENNLHEVGAGQLHDRKLVSVRHVCQTPLATFICPSRRSVRNYPCETSPPMCNTDFITASAKSDYAANAGDVYFASVPGPPSCFEGDLPSHSWVDTSSLTGIVFLRSEVAAKHVVDGLSKTLLVGEKYLAPEFYFYPGGDADGDDRPMYVGYDETSIRWTTNLNGIPIPPQQDNVAKAAPHQFGSAHATACHMLYCDGSVRVVSYVIDGKVVQRMGNRQDSSVADSNGL